MLEIPLQAVDMKGTMMQSISPRESLPARWRCRSGEMVRLPVLKELGKVIETAEQGKGRVPQEGVFYLFERHGYWIRPCLIWEPPLPHGKVSTACTAGHSRVPFPYLPSPHQASQSPKPGQEGASPASPYPELGLVIFSWRGRDW